MRRSELFSADEKEEVCVEARDAHRDAVHGFSRNSVYKIGEVTDKQKAGNCQRVK